MFANNVWIYHASLIIVAIVAMIMYSQQQEEYSLVDFGKGKKRNRNIYAMTIFMIGYIVFWAAIRNAFVDTSAYILAYKNINASSSIISMWKREDGDFLSKSPLYDTFQLLLKKMGFHWHVYLALVAIITGACIIYGIGKYTDDVAMSGFLFITSFNFIWMFNGIRQMLVVAVMFAALRLISEKKLIKFLMLVFIMYFIHKTCIIFVPIYFIANMKNWSYGIYACILITMIMTLAFPGRITGMLDSAFDEYNVAEEFANDDGTNIFRFLVAMVPPVIAYVYRKRLLEFENNEVKVLTNISLINAGLYAVSTVTSGIYMGRLPMYTEIFNIIFLPFLIKKAAKKEIQRTLFLGLVFFYLALYIYQVATSNLYYSTDLIEALKVFDVN